MSMMPLLSTHNVSDTGAILSQTCHNPCSRATATRSSGEQEGGKLEPKRIRIELQALCYFIYTILVQAYHPIEYPPDILQ